MTLPSTFIRNCHQHHHLPYIRVGLFYNTTQYNTTHLPIHPTSITHSPPLFSPTHRLGYSNATASSLVSIWSGCCYVTPLLGAFLADSYFGRYIIILSFSLIYLGGLTLLTLQAGISSLETNKVVFWVAMYLIALGTGGIKPCVSTFGADQFDTEGDPRQAKLIGTFFNWFYFSINIGAAIASLVLVNIQTNVSWFVGFLIPAISFTVAISVFVFGSKFYRRRPPGGSPWKRIFVTMYAAGWVHRKAKVPENDEDLYEVEGDESIVAGQQKLPRTKSFKWLEKAAVVLEDDEEEKERMTREKKKGGVVGPPPALSSSSKALTSTIAEDADEDADAAEYGKVDTTTTNNNNNNNKWLVTLTEIEEVKIVLRLVPVFLSLILYNAVYAQMSTQFILQGQGMDTSLGSTTIAPATLSFLDTASILILVPVYDLLVVPLFRDRLKRPISTLARIGYGYMAAILAMIVAGCLEVARLNVVHDNDLTYYNPAETDSDCPYTMTNDVPPPSECPAVVPISVWWQIPQYVLIGASEVLAMIGSLELFYSEAPDAMRSTCSAIQLLATGLGSYVAAALVAIVQAITGNPGWLADNVNQGHLDYYFFMLAVLMLLNLIVYIFIARNFRQKAVHPTHTTIDVEAIALAGGDSRILYGLHMSSQIRMDVNLGMVPYDSVREEMKNVSMGGSVSMELRQRLSRVRKSQSGRVSGLGGGGGASRLGEVKVPQNEV